MAELSVRRHVIPRKAVRPTGRVLSADSPMGGGATPRPPWQRRWEPRRRPTGGVYLPRRRPRGLEGDRQALLSLSRTSSPPHAPRSPLARFLARPGACQPPSQYCFSLGWLDKV